MGVFWVMETYRLNDSYMGLTKVIEDTAGTAFPPWYPKMASHGTEHPPRYSKMLPMVLKIPLITQRCPSHVLDIPLILKDALPPTNIMSKGMIK